MNTTPYVTIAICLHCKNIFHNSETMLIFQILRMDNNGLIHLKQAFTTNGLDTSIPVDHN